MGLWRAKRWAEYLTFIATTLLLIPEIYELTGAITATKIITLVINLVVVGYLLFAKRLFGLRGGGRAETAERDRDSGWPALERSLPARTPPRGSAAAHTTGNTLAPRPAASPTRTTPDAAGSG